LFVIAALLFFHGKSYYSFGIYPTLMAFGAYRLEYVTAKRLKLLRYVVAIVPFLFVTRVIPILLPVFPPQQLAAYYEKINAKKTGALRWEDQQDHPLPQDFADMLGWEEMARKVAAAYHSLSSAEQAHTIIYCDNYGQAGAVAFYAKKYGIPQPYSANASFLYWMPDTIHIENLVLLTDDSTDMDKPFVKQFASAVLTDSITAPNARERGDLVMVLKGADAAFNTFMNERMKKERSYFIKR
jgi:hypothetical protein